jgi:hypothetical protein
MRAVRKDEGFMRSSIDVSVFEVADNPPKPGHGQ